MTIGIALFGQLTHDQAKAAAKCINALRPDWDVPGIIDALGRARGRGDAPTVVMAAIRAATAPSNRTPAVIWLDGAHWRAPEPARPERRPAPKPHELCGICSEREDDCRRKWSHDHEYEHRQPRTTTTTQNGA